MRDPDICMRSDTTACEQPSHRREFFRWVGWGSGATVLAAPAFAEQEPPAPEKDSATLEADARMALVVARFGAHLDEAAKTEVRRQIQGLVRQGAELREVKLENSDAPFPIFRPFRAPLS
jgi:hypothetical protein